MPVLGDPARLERQRLKRAELVRVHDHYQDYSNHLSLVSLCVVWADSVTISQSQHNHR